MDWLAWTLHGLGALAVLFTLVPAFRSEYWWVRVWDFPRSQMAALLTLVLAALLSFRWPGVAGWGAWASVAAMGAALGWQLFRIWPYTVLHRRQVARAQRLGGAGHICILVANVLMTNRKAHLLLELVRAESPDVVLAVETDAWWQEQLAPIEADYPHKIHAPLPNTYGLLFYSRLPLRGKELNYLVESDIPSVRALIELPGGQEVQFFGVHPRPPAPAEAGSSLARDAELVLVARAAKASRLPTIVAGDLNDVAWSHTTRLFMRLGDMLDPRMGRGLFPTFNANWRLLRWPLDHIFHTRDFRLAFMRRLPHIGSDHFPILVRLSYEPEARPQQHGLELEPEHREEASQKVASALAGKEVS